MKFKILNKLDSLNKFIFTSKPEVWVNVNHLILSNESVK